MDPLLVPAGAVIVVGALIGFRWMARLQKAVDNHAERIAWLEAKVNGKDRHDV